MRGSKATKIPFNPHRPLAGAKSNDPATWATFEVAERLCKVESFDGLGFVFYADDPYVGIDLDNCRNPATGEVNAWGTEVLAKFGGYAEASPSGTGVHIIGRGLIPDGRGHKSKAGEANAWEAYDRLRYFCMTGDCIGQPEIIDCQPALEWLLKLDCSPVEALSPKIRIETPLIERARRYVARMDSAVSGQRGHDAAFSVAMRLVQDWALPEADAAALFREYSARCSPPWSEREIEHKIRSAIERIDSAKFGRLADSVREVHPKTDPEPVAAFDYATLGASEPSVCDELAQEFGDLASGKIPIIGFKHKITSEVTQAFKPGTLTVLCGTPGASKSLFLGEILMNLALDDIPVAIFHLEESRKFHARRHLAQLVGVSDITQDKWIATNEQHAKALLAQTHETMRMIGEFIDHAPGQTATYRQCIDWAKRKAGDGKRILAIDPVTLAEPEDDNISRADRRFVSALKSVMVEFGVSIVAVSHPPKASMGQQAAKTGQAFIDALAGGAAWSRGCQTLFWFEKIEETLEEPTLWTFDGPIQTPLPINRILHIAKARNGTGGGMQIAFHFDKDTLRSYELGWLKQKPRKRRA